MCIYISSYIYIWYTIYIQCHPQEKLRALQRLQRLEQRFTGPGVTEAEARNALRLFERELSKDAMDGHGRPWMAMDCGYR